MEYEHPPRPAGRGGSAKEPMSRLLPLPGASPIRPPGLPGAAVRGAAWLILLCGLCAAGWCQAAPTPSPTPSPTPMPTVPTPAAPTPAAPAVFAPVMVNGQVLFQVDGPNAQARAALINARLQTLITRQSDVTTFEVQRQGSNYLLVVGSIAVMTVTQSDAAVQGRCGPPQRRSVRLRIGVMRRPGARFVPTPSWVHC